MECRIAEIDGSCALIALNGLLADDLLLYVVQVENFQLRWLLMSADVRNALGAQSIDVRPR